MLEEATVDRRTQRHQATKAEILDAPWEIVRAEGLAALSLRDVAARVGMRAPSLYQYFESKHAIYDAMFGQGWQAYLDALSDAVVPKDKRTRLVALMRKFFDFAVADPARYQLMNQRTIPGFEPSPEAYAPAVAVYDAFRDAAAEIGITDQRMLDLWTALSTGLVNQQIANDPGGDRWRRLVEDAVDMYLHHVDRQRRKRK